MEPNKNNSQILNHLSYAFLGHNYAEMVCESSVFGKPVLNLDALLDKNLAKTYWLLDGNAFGDLPAPDFMKLDTLILGGAPISLVLPKEYVDPQLVQELEAEHLKYVPIGFIDLHKIGFGKFAVSGLGIAKPYQKKGLSKYLIYGGTKITGAKELIIPAQLSNSAAQHAWQHLELEVISDDVFHSELDTVVYSGKVPDNLEDILKKHSSKEIVAV